MTFSQITARTTSHQGTATTDITTPTCPADRRCLASIAPLWGTCKKNRTAAKGVTAAQRQTKSTTVIAISVPRRSKGDVKSDGTILRTSITANTPRNAAITDKTIAAALPILIHLAAVKPKSDPSVCEEYANLPIHNVEIRRSCCACFRQTWLILNSDSSHEHPLPRHTQDRPHPRCDFA